MHDGNNSYKCHRLDNDDKMNDKYASEGDDLENDINDKEYNHKHDDSNGDND